MTDQEYMDQAKTLFDIYSGILFNFSAFVPGEPADLTYGLHCPEYKTLLEKYPVAQIAGEGGDFERARRLLHHLAPRLKHAPMYDNHIPCDALHLLEYAYEQPDHGINCLTKSKILSECCLALGMYARRVWLMPFSPYDMDNHVVVELYDRDLSKWIMLDPTTDGLFVDEAGAALSVPEIRERMAERRFATYIPSDRFGTDPVPLLEEYAERNAYICKNMFYFTLEPYNGFGKRDGSLCFLPSGFSLRRQKIARYTYLLERHAQAEQNDLTRQYIASGRKQLEKAKNGPEPASCGFSVFAADPDLSNL